MRNRLSFWQALFIYLWITFLAPAPIYLLYPEDHAELMHWAAQVAAADADGTDELPAWKVTIVGLLTATHESRGASRFVAMICALAVLHVVREVTFPLLGILIKWLVIGRYRAGRFRLWGSYYLRWWFVHQTLRFCGKGVFDYSDGLRHRYYALLGAHIGEGARIAASCELTEADLVTIGDGTCLDAYTIVSPFCVDAGAAMLSAIDIGEYCAVCSRCTIAPGATVADDTCLGPLSSSHEQQDASEEMRAYCRTTFPPPPVHLWLLLGVPSHLFVAALKLALPLVTVYLMTLTRDNDPQSWSAAIDWFLSPTRLLLYFAVRLERVLICPFLELLGVILVKRLVVGKFKPGAATSWSRFQYSTMRSLLPDGTLCGVSFLVGNRAHPCSLERPA